MPSPAEPLTIPHGPSFANRVALAPLTNTQSNSDGTLSDEEHDYLVARAKGGFALTMTCAAYVSTAGRAWEGQLGISDDSHLPGLTRLAASLRAAGTVSSVQLHHGGMRASAALNGTPVEAPWDRDDPAVSVMTARDIARAVDDFTAAAVRAERAGFDGVEVHGAHGYLIGQFLDGRHNQRTDGYGGSLAERSRFLFEILHSIRSATGPDFQLGLRLSPQGYGIAIDEGREVARQVLESGLVAYLDMSLWDVRATPRSGEDQLLIDYFVDLPRGGTRLGVTGKVLTLEDAQWCLDKGADFISVGIGSILHHDWVTQTLADPGFAVAQRPVSAEHLRSEYVSPRFTEYLRDGWADFVA